MNTFFMIVGVCTATSWFMRLLEKLEAGGR